MAKYLDLDGLTRYNNKVNTKLDTKANVDGAYELMTVGNAEQLIASTTVEDKSPYLFRTSGGSMDIGDRLNLKSIVGGTVVWNQLSAVATDYEVYKGTKSTDGDTIIASYDSSTSVNMQIYKNVSIPANHKVLLSGKFYPTKAVLVKYLLSGGNYYSNDVTLTANMWNMISVVALPTANVAQMVFYTNRNGVLEEGDSVKAKDFQIIDLTQMFGSAIADYIYSLEQATAGRGVAYFKSLFPKDYYAYNAGQLMSVKALSHKMVGFNQWDEEWESGQYNAQGEPESDASRIRSKNYVRVLPSTKYYIKAPSTCGIRFYDFNKQFLGSQYNITPNNTTFITPSGAYYLRFSIVNTTVYANNACINLHWDGERDGEYEAYSEHIYPLDSDLELRGIPKLDANNNLYYDGDTYESDGTVTRKYGVVDLGSLSWNTIGTAGSFYANILLKNNSNPNANIICEKYYCYGNGNDSAIFESMPDKSCAGFYNTSSTNSWVYIKDSAYASNTGGQFKTAMSGVYLIYELATPTTETADTFQSLQIVDDFGTEEFVDNRDVPIPVGHLTDYYPDLRAKLEMTPNSPDGNGDYLVRQTNGINEYVEYVSPIPTPPTTDGTYVLKATVSSGVATLSWVEE